MANWIGQIQSVLTVAAIVAMLTWGVYASLWTFPNDQSTIIQAVLNGEFQTISNPGPTGNGTIITPGSEALFIMMYRSQGPPGMYGGALYLPNGHGFVVGPFSSITSSSSPPSYSVNYAVFSFLFDTTFGKPVALWFTGPQGNLSQSFATSVKGGLDAFLPRSSGPSVSGTDIFEISGPGNYTLHFVNNGSANETGKLAMGPSSVTYSRPYIIPGIATTVLGAGLAVFTTYSLRNKSKRLPGAGDTHLPTVP